MLSKSDLYWANARECIRWADEAKIESRSPNLDRNGEGLDTAHTAERLGITARCPSGTASKTPQRPRLVVPIRPFLAGQAFEPDVITTMHALERVCDKLRLRVIDDSATRLVAEKIIELAQRGIRDADTLASMVLNDLQPDRFTP